MSSERARDLALGLASNFKPMIIRIKPERISSYGYAKEGLIQVSADEVGLNPDHPRHPRQRVLLISQAMWVIGGTDGFYQCTGKYRR